MNVLEELNLGRRRRLPTIIAAEAAECGLACMAMVGAYHGHDIDLNGLRQRFSLSISGATLRNLMGLADQLGFSTRPLRVELSSLAKVQAPAILHWDLNHFVVLKAVGAKTATIHDPARGAVTLSLDEVSKHFTGVALELSPAANFAKVTAREPIKLTSLWTRSHGFWGAAVQVLGHSAALQVAAFAAPSRSSWWSTRRSAGPTPRCSACWPWASAPWCWCRPASRRCAAGRCRCSATC
jgi:ATP-binding cassette subfamily B protein RaxB